jgi:hypothetical protein
MKRNQIIASLGALAATGLAVYLIKRKRRSVTNGVNHVAATSVHNKYRSKSFSKAKAFMYEPDDHPE